MNTVLSSQRVLKYLSRSQSVLLKSLFLSFPPRGSLSCPSLSVVLLRGLFSIPSTLWVLLKLIFLTWTFQKVPFFSLGPFKVLLSQLTIPKGSSRALLLLSSHSALRAPLWVSKDPSQAIYPKVPLNGSPSCLSSSTVPLKPVHHKFSPQNSIPLWSWGVTRWPGKKSACFESASCQEMQTSRAVMRVKDKRITRINYSRS